MNYDKRAKKYENLEIGEISYRDEDSLEESPIDENKKKKQTNKQQHHHAKSNKQHYCKSMFTQNNTVYSRTKEKAIPF